MPWVGEPVKSPPPIGRKRGTYQRNQPAAALRRFECILGNQPLQTQKEDMTMTTMLNPQANGRKRASLDDQINRLDHMLDGLSEGLNEAVADAVKTAVGTAVKEAVQAVLTEVLTNPDIRARFQQTLAGPAKEPAGNEALTDARGVRQHLAGWWQRLRICIVGLRVACAGAMQKVRTSASNARQWADERLSTLWVRYEVIRPFKYQILTALGIGLLVAIAGGIGGFVTSLAVQAGLWLRKVLTRNAEQAS